MVSKMIYASLTFFGMPREAQFVQGRMARQGRCEAVRLDDSSLNVNTCLLGAGPRVLDHTVAF